MIIDAYYLALERSVRDIYNNFVKKLNNKKAQEEEIFIIKPELKIKKVIFCLGSFSVWPFYLIIFFAIIITKYLI
jgi:hypothetical protein